MNNIKVKILILSMEGTSSDIMAEMERLLVCGVL